MERDRTVDPEAVTSQVQLALSRDLARQVIKQLKLGELPEFDSALRGVSLMRYSLGFLGLAKDPLSMTPEERVLEAYYERLTVFPVDKSRVISVEFQSADPELAAKVANAIADTYLTHAADRARRSRPARRAAGSRGEIDVHAQARGRGRGQGRGIPLQDQPVHRHQQHLAVEPDAGRVEPRSRGRALAEGRARSRRRSVIRDMLKRGGRSSPPT